jgi:hypothetical protein
MSCKCDTINIVNDNNVIVVSHADGRDGKSAYQQAVEGGYTGTEQEFNCSLSLLADVAEGKKQIADAINTKGGNSTPDESFQQLAEDIESLPIDGNFTYGIEFVEKSKSIIEQLADSNGNINFNDLIDNIIDTEGRIRYNSRYSFTAKNIIYLPLLTSTSAYTVYTAKKLILPNCISLGNNSLSSDRFVEMTFGKISTMVSQGNKLWGDLRTVTIGQDTDTILYFQNWTATNVITEGQSGIDELNANLYNNLLTKLADHSTDGQTRKLRLGWLAHVTQENIDYANSKGWTLTT